MNHEIRWMQHFKCTDLLPFFVIYDSVKEPLGDLNLWKWITGDIVTFFTLYTVVVIQNKWQAN